MPKDHCSSQLSRRQLLRLTATGATALAARRAFPELMPQVSGASLQDAAAGISLYSSLLKTWCDGLLTYQVKELRTPALFGALLCPACGLVHGRCADAIYPLLHMAHISGQARYLDRARLIYDWTERQVSRPDGSWVNDISLQDWQGITVFRTVALAETLRHHGALLDAATRQRWTDRVARAAKFLDGFITIDSGNINYPASACYCFALCGQVLGDSHYTDRGRTLVHTCLEYMSRPNYLIYGEGHPIDNLSPKGLRPVDLGYNVEESLPGFALYASLTGDPQVTDMTVKALRSQMEFMLPDGGWDNSWGCRNYKWTWWGSRTSDGCQPAYILMADHDPRFREVAQRNLELMAACTHNGLLYGGPDYHDHGDFPCIHHSLTHAKALTTVLDMVHDPEPKSRASLPCEQPYGLKSFSEVGTHLVSSGPWRATVTEYDWKEPGEEYGHVTGGALSLLFHRGLGPILTASMTKYDLIEPPNQQAVRDASQAELAPRIECNHRDQTFTSFCDFKATLQVADSGKEISFDSHGRLLTPEREPLPGDGARYHLTYRMSEQAIEIIASASGSVGETFQFVLPVICRRDEEVKHDKDTLRIAKPKGQLTVHVRSVAGIEFPAEGRVFNLVPGFECLPIVVPMGAGEEIRIRLEAAVHA